MAVQRSRSEKHMRGARKEGTGSTALYLSIPPPGTPTVVVPVICVRIMTILG